MSLRDTKRRLTDWGRWASGGGVQGFPMTSAFMRYYILGPDFAPPPPDILRTDHIVARAEITLRKVLIRQYCSNGTLREKAAKMGMCKSTYWDRLDEGIWFVHIEYDKPDQQPVDLPDKKCYLGPIIGRAAPEAA